MALVSDYTLLQNTRNTITFQVVDSGGSPISDWDSRIQFEEVADLPDSFSGPSITLPFNPTDIVRTQPIRTEITPSVTFDNNYNPNAIVQSWGASVPRWTIRGHTGYSSRPQFDNIDGYQTYVALFRFFESYSKLNILRLQDSPPKQAYQMVFINWTDKFQDWWYVEPTKIPDKIRSADKPLYYNYDIELVGVKPFNEIEKVSDDLSLIVSDPTLRLKKVGISLGIQADLLNNFVIGGVSKPILNSYLDIQDGINTIITQNLLVKGLQQGVLIAKDVLGTITTAVQDIKALVKTVLSPLFTLVNIYQQIKCTLLTLIALPLDLYTSSYDSIKALIQALKASGCGTTLISDVTKVGFNSLRL